MFLYYYFQILVFETLFNPDISTLYVPSNFKHPSLSDGGSMSEGTSVRYKLSVCDLTIRCSHLRKLK